jgi:hypothetical protein
MRLYSEMRPKQARHHPKHPRDPPICIQSKQDTIQDTIKDTTQSIQNTIHDAIQSIQDSILVHRYHPGRHCENPSFFLLYRWFFFSSVALDTRMRPGWYSDDGRMICRMILYLQGGWYSDDTRMILGWYQDATRMIPGWYSDDRMILGWWHYLIGWWHYIIGWWGSYHPSPSLSSRSARPKS